MNPKNYKPSNVRTSGTSGKLNLENNAQFNGYRDDLAQVYDQAPLRPNYTRQELNNADIPTKIGREIRAEKYRIFFVSFISFIMMVVGVFFIACAYGAKEVTNDVTGQVTKWLIPKTSVPAPGFMIVLTIVGLGIFTLAMIQYAHLLTNVRSYKADILDGVNNIPYFLVHTYKSLIARVVYANWIALTCYLILGIMIGVLWALKAAVSGWWDKFNTELIVAYVLLGVVFAAHMLTLFTAKYRKGNLNSYYNTQIVSDEQAHEISHHANKICWVSFVIFLAVILFVFTIVYLIIRRSKKKPLLP